jgi:hypothetical protein
LSTKRRFGLGLGLAILAAGAVNLVTPAPGFAIPSTWKWRPMRTVGLLAQANNRYVSIDARPAHTLRSGATKPGGDEQYLLIGDCERSGCLLMARSTGKYVTIGDPGDGQYGVLRATSYLARFTDLFLAEGDCTSGCGLKSTATGKYVTVRTSPKGVGNAILKATATAVGPRERFNLVSEFCPVHGCAIQSLANNRYVTADIGRVKNSGILKATATSVHHWERFLILGDCRSPGGCAVKSMANGRYVAADLERSDTEYGTLRARSTEPRSWERIALRGDCADDHGCAIEFLANHLHVTPDLARPTETYGRLRAVTKTIKSWERFRLVP